MDKDHKGTAKMEELIEKVDDEAHSLKDTVATHMLNEKKLKKLKFKKENQLLSWLTKYDSEISERSEVIDELTKEHEDLIAKRNELQENMANIGSAYDKMNEQKAEIFAQKVEEFRMNRAARVIQGLFHDIMRRSGKYKGKGKKGKKKNKAKAK